MKKDIMLGFTDWCKHTRNTKGGKRYVNKRIRRRVKAALKK